MTTHAMPFGAQLLAGGGARFRLWAPGAECVEVQLQRGADHALHRMRTANGWHELIVREAGAGSRYKYVVHRGAQSPLAVPDPASRFNPDGVHGASVVVDPDSYRWREASWSGRPWSEAAIYELHVGAFTAEGTYAAARRRLPELAALGVTAIELMPLAAFPGGRNWGYDGVLLFAPAACYGSPDELKALIDAAHSAGLMVLLDVVYNHFGPDGNYLHAYCPEFFNPGHRTPWGAAINFDGALNATVRDFFVHNALFWLEEYRFDGLRLDAVHAIRDDGTPDIVCEIARAMHQAAGRARQRHLVLENHANQSGYLVRDSRGAPVYATAQWNDDAHHALHVLISGETDGYYADYASAPLMHLGRSLAEGFSYQGEQSAFQGESRGEASGHLPPAAFIGFLQNHDMIGNRAFGDRVDAYADERLLTAAYACLLLTPQVPMLFMGEEFASSTPFLYFCDFQGDLAAAVSNGRREEFKRFAAFSDGASLERIPDPNAAATFDRCKLRWDEREHSPHKERLALVRELLALRRRHLVPWLPHIAHGGRYRVDGALLRLEWEIADGGAWRLAAYFGRDEIIADGLPAGDVVFEKGLRRGAGGAPASAHQARLGPGAVLVSRGPE